MEEKQEKVRFHVSKLIEIEMNGAFFFGMQYRRDTNSHSKHSFRFTFQNFRVFFYVCFVFVFVSYSRCCSIEFFLFSLWGITEGIYPIQFEINAG